MANWSAPFSIKEASVVVPNTRLIDYLLLLLSSLVQFDPLLRIFLAKRDRTDQNVQIKKKNILFRSIRLNFESFRLTESFREFYFMKISKFQRNCHQALHLSKEPPYLSFCLISLVYVFVSFSVSRSFSFEKLCQKFCKYFILGEIIWLE